MYSHSSKKKTRRLVVASRAEETVRVRKAVSALVRLDGFTPDDALSIEIAAGEGLANAVRHGSPHGDSDTVEVRYVHVPGHYAEVIIQDRGPGFDLERCLANENPLSFSEGERGLFLISHLMDEISYSCTERGGFLRMRKYHPPSDGEEGAFLHFDSRQDRSHHGVRRSAPAR